MSEATGLSIVIEPVNALAVFTQPDHIEQILQQVEEEVSAFVFDARTKKGRDAMASLGLKVAKTKTYLDGLGKDLVTEYKEVPKKIDASRKVVRDRLDALKEKVLQPKLEWEAEQERIKTYNDMRDEADQMNAEFDAAAAALAELIESDHEKALLMNEIHDRDAAEAKAEAERQRIAHEEELKREAAERAKREVEQKAKAELEASAKREADFKAAAELAERQRIEGEAKAAREKQEAAEQAERDKKAAIEAEQRKAKEEADRIKAAAELKELNRLAEEKRIADEAAKRAADVEHRRTVNNKAVADLVAAGVPEDCAIACIKAIAKGEVTAIRITY